MKLPDLEIQQPIFFSGDLIVSRAADFLVNPSPLRAHPQNAFCRDFHSNY